MTAEQRSERMTPHAFHAIARIVRAVRNGAASAQQAAEAAATATRQDGTADPVQRAHARGYALGWSACATLAALTAADAGAQDAIGDLALTHARMRWEDGTHSVEEFAPHIE